MYCVGNVTPSEMLLKNSMFYQQILPVHHVPGCIFSLDGNTIISELIASQLPVKNCPCGKKTKLTLSAPGFLAGVAPGGGVFTPSLTPLFLKLEYSILYIFTLG